MKKIGCIVLCAVLTLSLCACGGRLENLRSVELPPLPQITEEPTPTPAPSAPPETPLPVTTPEPAPTPAPTQVPTPEPVQESDYVSMSDQILVNVRRTTMEQYDPETGLKRILRFSYDTPVFSMEGRDAVAAVVNAELALQDELFYTGGDDGGYNGLLELAEDNYTMARQSGGEVAEFNRSRTVRVCRADSRMLSLVYDESEYIGDPMANYSEYGLVFDSQTGKVLTLEDLAPDYEAMRSHLLLSLVSLTETDESLYQHLYTDYVPNLDFYTKLGQLLRPGAWYFDEQGMVFVSRLYELGPYAAGLCHFHIPYSRLATFIDRKWLPQERTEAGNLSVIGIESVPNGSIGFVDRVELSRQGDEVCLIAAGTVYDVSLTEVYYDDVFHDTGMIWYCSGLKNAAVQVKTIIPEGLPNLKVGYTDTEGTLHSVLLTVSGLDGSLQLVSEDQVHPVG